jgi:hypothetical protein
LSPWRAGIIRRQLRSDTVNPASADDPEALAAWRAAAARSARGGDLDRVACKRV